MIQFRVYGVAQPKGSARAFLPKGWKRPIVTSANPNLKSWERSVREALQVVMSTTPGDLRATLFEAPISLTLAFYLPRPKSAPRRVILPTKRPDLDKCVRSTIDALSKIAFKDDTQVVEIVATKHYAADAAHVDIGIAPYAPPLLSATYSQRGQLKPSYFALAVKNMQAADAAKSQGDLFQGSGRSVWEESEPA